VFRPRSRDDIGLTAEQGRERPRCASRAALADTLRLDALGLPKNGAVITAPLSAVQAMVTAGTEAVANRSRSCRPRPEIGRSGRS